MDFNEANDVFMTDPFLSLDNDLDDVSDVFSEVIRSNMVGDFHKGIFDASRTPSPQYLHDTEIYIPQMMQQQFSKENSKGKEIDNIVSQLQDEMLSGIQSNNDFSLDNMSSYYNQNVVSSTLQNNTSFHFHHSHQTPTTSSFGNLSQSNHLELNNIQNSQQEHYYAYDDTALNFAASATNIVAKADNEHLLKAQQHQQIMNYQTGDSQQYAAETGDYLLVEYPQEVATTSVVEKIRSPLDGYASSCGMIYNEAEQQQVLENLSGRRVDNNKVQSSQHQVIQIPQDAFILETPSLNHIHSNLPLQHSSSSKSILSTPSSLNLELIEENRNSSLPQNNNIQHNQHQKYVKQEMDEQSRHISIHSKRKPIQLPPNYISQKQQGRIKTLEENDVEQQLLALNMGKNGPSSSSNITSNNTKTEIIRMLLEMTPAELENLRSSRHRTPLSSSTVISSSSNSKFATDPSSTFLQQHLLYAPPLDPPPPAAEKRWKNSKMALSASTSNLTSNTNKRKATKNFSMNMELNNKKTIFNTDARSGVLHINTTSLSLCNDRWQDKESEDTEPEDNALSPNYSSSATLSPNKKGPKTERRTAHNLIEKKYRCSINDRINHLKEMLAADEIKLSKSATLRKAIEHINVLRAQNLDLQDTNKRLRTALNAAGISIGIEAESPPPQPPFPGTRKVRVTKSEYYSDIINGLSRDSSQSPDASISTTHSSTENYSPRQQQQPQINQISPSTAKKARQMLGQSRVTLCVFMCMMLAFNPVSVFLSSVPSTSSLVKTHYGPLDSMGLKGISNKIQQNTYHRTLRSIIPFNEPAFDDSEVLQKDEFKEEENETKLWWQAACLRQAFIWTLNSCIVIFVLLRLLVYGEPVSDSRSSAWTMFLLAKQQASLGIRLGNYREAQRKLFDALQILGRPLPANGGFEEFMSFVWQCIRHLLNGIWIGRWLARRRRYATQNVYVVCRSHAATALLYLIGVKGIEISNFGALHLALSAVNLAESAGISRDGISHRLRAYIYINAAIQMRVSVPLKFFAKITYAYFLRRAKRHVRKAESVDCEDLRAISWMFHPLAQNFLATKSANCLLDILQQSNNSLDSVKLSSDSRLTLYFPFADTLNLNKPVNCLTGAFKIHLLTMLMNYLATLNTQFHCVDDFVEISHLLLHISGTSMSATMSDTKGINSTNKTSNPNDRSLMADWDATTEANTGTFAEIETGDELCTWWTHLITCGLYWRHGNTTRAQKHYALVRKCPLKILKNELTLSIGLAFCTRKMCYDDTTKRNFRDMVWMHAEKAFAYVEKDHFGLSGLLRRRKSSVMVSVMEKLARGITYEWLMMSLLDIWNDQLIEQIPYWEQCAPSPLRKLYYNIFEKFVSLGDFCDHKKVLTFQLLGRALTGGNPISTWALLKALLYHDLDEEENMDYIDARFNKKKEKNNIFSSNKNELHCHLGVMQRLRKDFCTYCNLSIVDK